MVNVLFPFLLPTLCKEIRIVGHFYFSGIKESESFLKGLDEEVVCDSIEP